MRTNPSLPSLQRRRGASAATLLMGHPLLLGREREPAEAIEDPREVPLWKRGLDLACVCLAMPAILPLMALIAIAIKWVSPGPVLFRQERVGHRGVRFVCWKFRSMRVGANPAAHREHVRNLLRNGAPMAKLDAAGDSRLIPGGAWLRASGLDELPQLLNVLRGEMSLVGPRPCLPFEAEAYLPWQRARFDTLPGLTGLWQVSGKNRTTFDQMIELDVEYARGKTLWLDLKILARTYSVLAGQIRNLSSGGARRNA